MSFNVAIVGEDPTNNGYILRPLVEKILILCGKPRAKVSMVSNPRTSGYEHAVALLKSEILRNYKHVDLLLFLPDADGKDRTGAFQELANHANQTGTNLICCAAIQEVETWLLAGHTDKLNESWTAIRANRSVKEEIFESFLIQHGDARSPGAGREQLMVRALQGYDGMKARCTELAELERQICDATRRSPE